MVEVQHNADKHYLFKRWWGENQDFMLIRLHYLYVEDTQRVCGGCTEGVCGMHGGYTDGA